MNTTPRPRRLRPGTVADQHTSPTPRGLSRRHLFGAGAGALGAAGLGWGAHQGVEHLSADDRVDGTLTEPFYGAHQGGIATTPQAHAQFVGLNLKEGTDRGGLAGILRVWTEDAARLASGTAALADTEPELAAVPARLTVTVGLGVGAFTAAAAEHHAPVWLHPLPAFPIDRLDETRWGQTDLLLQICADDPVTVAHATRVLIKNVRTRVSVAWTQRGFRNASRSQPAGTTVRNLMGQIDGTTNPAPAEFDRLV